MILPEFVHRHIVYPFWAYKDGNYPFSYLTEFERNQYLSADKLDELRWQRLKTMLSHAFNTTPYYHKTWSALGIHPEDIKNWSDVERLPLLEKADIQNNLEDLVSSQYAVSDLVRNQTGGSTGQPLVFYHDKARMASRLASTIRHDRWAGKDYSTRYACFWGHPAESQNSLGNYWEQWKEKNIYRVMFLDTSSLSVERFQRFVGELKQANPDVYLSYANSMYLYARFLDEFAVRDYHRPKSIITSAELLTEEMRQLIERVFECKVFNRYGCREVSVIASECDHHNGLHVNADALHVEITKNGRAVPAGEQGEIVITDLLNFGMPLIRYKIRDVGKRLEGACGCGKALPRIDLSGGRVTDFISTPDGRIVSGASLTIYLIANAQGVAQAQLYQDEIGSVVIRIYKGDGYSDRSTSYLLDTAKHFLGDQISIAIEFLSEPIPVSASGKYRFSISTIDPFR